MTPRLERTYNRPLGHRSSATGRMLRLAAFSILFLIGRQVALPQAESDAEYRVKLAFLYNFAQFVQWPADAFSSPTAPLTICVAGADPFQGDIGAALRDRTAGGHPIQLKKLKSADDPKACQIIFIRASEKAAARRLLAILKGANTLAVGEANGFTDLGGTINLTLVDNKLRFEINLDAAMQTRLKISSKLLSLAKIVRVEPTP